MTYLSFGHMSWKQKAYAFLWVQFLECGGDWVIIRFKLGRCRGFTTDRGTEAGITELEDCLPEFLESLGIFGCPRIEFLFPNSIWTPGWHHLNDGTIQEVLEKLEYFQPFLAALRGITKFLRIDTYRQKLIVAVELQGHSTKVLKSPPARFANWRLGYAVRSVAVHGLRHHAFAAGVALWFLQ